MAIIEMTFFAKSISRLTEVKVFIPEFTPDMARAGKHAEDVHQKGTLFQTLWLTHGGSGDDSDYINFSSAALFAQENMLALVMPDAHNRYYHDHGQGDDYFTFFTSELPEIIYRTFPLSPRRSDNFIGGLSMGCHGAVKCAIYRPDRYAAVLAMSSGSMFFGDNPSIYGKPPATGMTMPLRPAMIGAKNQKQAEKIAKAGIDLPEFFFCVGGDDFGLRKTHDACEFLANLGFKTHWQVTPGYVHEWDFWEIVMNQAMKEWLPIKRTCVAPESECLKARENNG